jgi:hypothetical protein
MFPNHPPQYPEYLDLEGVSEDDLARWKEGLVWFLKCLTLENPKRMVLKSPPHTARIRVLLDLFPDARFVHIYRDLTFFPTSISEADTRTRVCSPGSRAWKSSLPSSTGCAGLRADAS